MSDNVKEAKHQFAEKIIEALKTNSAPWQKPWDASQSGLPCNGLTLKEYSGWNMVELAMQNFEDNRFVTFLQAQKLNAVVRKGSKGFKIWRPCFVEEEDPKNPKKKKQKLIGFKAYTVFNASQVHGMPEQAQREKHTWTPCGKAEEILSNSNAKIIYTGVEACYIPSLDEIHLPSRDRFFGDEEFYSTALHELAHWTGHSSRLDRKNENFFGSPEYAREELVAEIASWMLCVTLGLNRKPEQNTAYVRSWIKAISDDEQEIFTACQQADKVKSLLLSYMSNDDE